GTHSSGPEASARLRRSLCRRTSLPCARAGGPPQLMIFATLFCCFFQRPRQASRAALVYPERRRRAPPVHSSVHSAVGAQQFSPARKRWVRSAMNTESAVGAEHSLAPGASEAEDAALKDGATGRAIPTPGWPGCVITVQQWNKGRKQKAETRRKAECRRQKSEHGKRKTQVRRRRAEGS